METKRKKIFKKIYGKFSDMNEREKIIEQKDKIIIGFSGGKDSLLLTNLLGQLMKDKRYQIEVLAIHVTNKQVGYELDLEHAKEICNQFQVPIITLESEEMPIQDIEDVEKNTTFCLHCGQNRRRALLQYAQEHGYKSIALGHHMDDVAETLLMNQMFCGCLAGIPAQFTTEKYGVKFIRPLIEVPVILIEEWTSYIELPRLIRCKYEKESMRGEVRSILSNLKQKYPYIIQCIAQSPKNIKKDYL